MASTKTKPKKPRIDFPLFAHANGQWAKKICGKLHYFGRWGDPKTAEARYLFEAPYIRAGRSIPIEGVELGVTVAEVCNKFLDDRNGKVESGEITPKTFNNYLLACRLLTEGLGRHSVVQDLTHADFAKLRKFLATGRKLKSLDDYIGGARSVFKFAYDCELIASLPRYGQAFGRVKKEQLRKERQKTQLNNGKRMFESAEIRRLFAAANPTIGAMTLLGVNAGLGNTDCSELDWSMINWRTGWVDYPRVKTGAQRRFNLWPETKAALEEFRSTGQTSGRVFSTSMGNPYVRFTSGGAAGDAIGKAFGKLLTKLELKRPGLGFYALRHTFETIGGETGDQVAVNHVMGHADNSMAAAYRERVTDERLVKVTDHVHDWLFKE